MSKTVTQIHLSRHPDKRESWAGRTVRIWSGEWKAFWRSNSAGYTYETDSAGLYSFEDAWKATSHCGPEKKIKFELVSAQG